MISRPVPLVIGHRGASAARPENTVAAFRHARELGADWVEFDVRRTQDGALVIHHDAVLPDGRAIVEHRLADLPDSIPSLVEALAACVGMGVNVEIKNDPDDPDFDRTDQVAEAVVEVLIGGGDLDATDPDRVLVTSFNPATIATVRRLGPAIATGLLAFDCHDVEATVALAVSGGHVAVNPWDPFVDERFMMVARSAGLAVYPWTVDDPIRIAALLALGVDGVITNVPDVARRLVDQR